MQSLTTSLTRPAYWLPLAVCLLSLYSCNSSADKDKPAQADATPAVLTQPTAASVCDKSNIEYRHEIYDSTAMDSLRKIFVDHFKVELAGKTEEMKDPVLRIPLSTIESAEKLVAKPDKPVRGIYISYGLDGDRFHPIFEFMYPEPGSGIGSGDLKVFDGAAFSFDGKDLKPESDPKKYTDAYFKDTRVDRTGSGSPKKLQNDPENADPLATWYRYEGKVNDLVAQNKVNDPALVVSCISQKLCYDAIVHFTGDPEFRHLLALHIGDGTGDNLTTGNDDQAEPLRNRAMDMGVLCPPRCEPKAH